jgi:Domain of unknown function (DUF397)
MERVTGFRWRKSSHSGSNGGGCVEVGGHDGQVLVRDTQDRHGPVLWFRAESWRTFARQMKKADGK